MLFSKVSNSFALKKIKQKRIKNYLSINAITVLKINKIKYSVIRSVTSINLNSFDYFYTRLSFLHRLVKIFESTKLARLSSLKKKHTNKLLLLL